MGREQVSLVGQGRCSSPQGLPVARSGLPGSRNRTNEGRQYDGSEYVVRKVGDKTHVVWLQLAGDGGEYGKGGKDTVE